MRVYEPRIEVRLVKTRRRKEVVAGISVATDRFGRLASIDLTPYLSEHGGVSTSKSIREQAGAFSISISDKPDALFAETLYGLIEPMDMVEIRIAHDPFTASEFDELEQPESVAEKRARLQADFNQIKSDWSAALSPSTKLTNDAVAETDPVKKRAMLLESESIRKSASAKYQTKYDDLKIELDSLSGQTDGPRKKGSGRLPIVMRGFVSSISRNQVMAGERPMRTLNISGQDFGKILGLIQIFYLNNSTVGENITDALKFFHKYSETSSAKIVSAEKFVHDVLTMVINPYVAGLAKSSDPASVGAQTIDALLADITVSGTLDPFTPNSFVNTSLYNMLTTILDVGAFNELYVEDRHDAPYLVVRPAPFVAAGGRDGDFIQAGAKAHYIDVAGEDIVALNVSRTDQGVGNYFWVHSDRWGFENNQMSQEQAQTGNADSFILFNYDNCHHELYGERKMETSIVLGPDDYVYSDSAKKDLVRTNTVTMSNWLDARRKTLADSNKDNALFETGSIRLRGNEGIKAGRYIRLRGPGINPVYYVSRVDHEFVPFQGFFTTVTVERGTGFIERIQAMNRPFYAEMDVKGVR